MPGRHESYDAEPCAISRVLLPFKAFVKRVACFCCSRLCMRQFVVNEANVASVPPCHCVFHISTHVQVEPTYFYLFFLFFFFVLHGSPRKDGHQAGVPGQPDGFAKEVRAGSGQRGIICTPKHFFFFDEVKLFVCSLCVCACACALCGCGICFVAFDVFVSTCQDIMASCGGLL